jgi:hypothetical protein
MSEADRVLPRQREQGVEGSSSERRLILGSSRRKGSGCGSSRVVEVVHVRRGGAKTSEDGSPPARWYVRAETWPEGFRAKSPLPLPPHDIQLASTEPAQPTVHVMAMWEPSSPQPVQPSAKPADPPVKTAAVERPKPHTSTPSRSTGAGRHFSDPFTESDCGANCIRCGYTVEQARDKRGLRTCSRCG